MRRAYAAASGGPVAEGSVGGGTGMICYLFKGGIGTSSRVLPAEMGGYTVGVLVQANFGWREDYIVNGAPVGRMLNGDVIPLPAPPEFAVHPPAGSFAPVRREPAPSSASPRPTRRCCRTSATPGAARRPRRLAHGQLAATTGAATSSSPSRPPTGCPAPA